MTQSDVLFENEYASTNPDVSSSVDTSVFSIINTSTWGLLCLIMTLLAFVFILYTELRYLYRKYFYKKCLNEVVDGPMCPDPAYEGKLVFLVGKLHTKTPVYLFDPNFPFFEVTGVFLLRRQVEMLQWNNGKKNSLEKVWSGSAIKLKNRQIQNPTWDFGFKSQNLCENVEVFVSNLRLCGEARKILQKNENFKAITPCQIKEKTMDRFISADGLYYYILKDEVGLQVGDYRVRYFYLELGNFVTVLGEYKNGRIEKFNNQLIVVENGVVTVELIFARLLEEELFKQNLFRVFGALSLMIGGIIATFNF